jgi:hypothetical protein
MTKLERHGVQSQSALSGLQINGSIFHVPQNRVSEFREMNANLIRSPGFQTTFQQRKPAA